MALIDRYFIEKYQLKTPFFIYNTGIIKRQFLKLKRFLPRNFEIFYSVKTNPHPRILGLIKKLKLGVEITSKGELLKVKKIGFASSRIIFTGPGKSDEELRDAIRAGIYLIIAESLNEARRINHLAGILNKRQEILLRLNMRLKINERNSLCSLTGSASKFGVDEEILPVVIQQINELKHVGLAGLQSYSASGVLDYKILLAQAEYLFKIAKKVFQKTGNRHRIIDIGGGLGINYTRAKKNDFEIEKFGAGLKKLIARHKFENIKIILEIGRYLVAESADYIAKVLDIKTSHGVKFIIIDGGIHHLCRGCVSPEASYVELLSRRKKIKTKEKVDIVGRLVYPSDFITKNTLIHPCKVGDFLAIRYAGAYGLTAGMVNFSSHPLPKEIFLNKRRR